MFDNFEGEIDGATVTSIRKDFNENYRKPNHNSQERLEDIIELLNKYDKFFVGYFDDVYKPNINTTDVLSDGMNGCALVSLFNTYIIRGDIDDLLAKGSESEIKKGRELRSYYDFSIS